MNLNGDRDRFLIALGAAIVFHIGIAIGMTFVEWSSPPRSTTLTVDLGAPVETEIPEVDPESMEEEPEERDPEEPDEPEEPEPEDQEEPEDPEPPDPEEFEAADTQAGPGTDSTDSQQREQSEEPPPPPPPQGPTPEEVARILDEQLGMGDDDRQRERRDRSSDDQDPNGDRSSIDSDTVTQRRQEARAEFERILQEQEEQRRASASEQSDDENGQAGGDPDTQVSATVRGLLESVSAPRDESSGPGGSGDSGNSDDTTGDDSTGGVTNGNDSSEDDSGGGNGDPDDPEGGNDIVTWDGEGDRALVQYSLPEMDGSDLRASGAPEVLARISFVVDERGIVMPGTVQVRAPGLTTPGRAKIRDAVSDWRFESRPGTARASGSVDFIFQRSGGG